MAGPLFESSALPTIWVATRVWRVAPTKDQSSHRMVGKIERRRRASWLVRDERCVGSHTCFGAIPNSAHVGKTILANDREMFSSLQALVLSRGRFLSRKS